MIEVDKNTIVAVDIESTGEKKKNGIYIPAEGFSSRGIRPRWCKIYKVGSDITSVKVGEWAYVEHGRWTYAIDTTDDNGEPLKVWILDEKAIMAVTDEQPEL